MFGENKCIVLCFLLAHILLGTVSSFQISSSLQRHTKLEARKVNVHVTATESGDITLEEAAKDLEEALAELPSESELLEAKRRLVQERLIASETASAAPILDQFQSLVPPPFDARLPGKTTTDPAWQAVLITTVWLGIPVNIEDSADFLPSDKPSFCMGNEVFEDPNEIMSMLCERYVLSDLVESATPIQEVIAPLYPSFVKFVTNTDVTVNKQLKKDLQSNLYFLNKRIERSRGEFIESDEVTIGDLVLAPQLHHMKVALKEFKNFEFSKELEALVKYMDNLHSMECIQRCLISEEAIIAKYEALRESEQ